MSHSKHIIITALTICMLATINVHSRGRSTSNPTSGRFGTVNTTRTISTTRTVSSDYFLSANDHISFIMNNVGRVYYDDGLRIPVSFPTADNGISYTYDIALYSMALTLANLEKDFFLGHVPLLDLVNLKRKSNSRSFFHAYYAADGATDPDIESIESVGHNAYILQAACLIKHYDYETYEEIDKLAEELSTYLMFKVLSDPEAALSFPTYNKDASGNVLAEFDTYSTENNLVAYVALKNYGRTYSESSFLSGTIRNLEAFFDEMLISDGNGKTYLAGGYSLSEDGVMTIDRTCYSDVQALASLIFGDGHKYSQGLKKVYDVSLLDNNEHLVVQEISAPFDFSNNGKTVQGIDLDGRNENFSHKTDVVWVEGTFQVALAYLINEGKTILPYHSMKRMWVKPRGRSRRGPGSLVGGFLQSPIAVTNAIDVDDATGLPCVSATAWASFNLIKRGRGQRGVNPFKLLPEGQRR